MVAYLQDFHHLACLDPAWDASVLQLVPYYDLINGYKELFMSGDKFKPGISFEYLYFFHAFDHSLQNILFEFSVIIENYFKNNLAHVISRDFGVDVGDYLSYKNYRSSRGGVRFDDIFSKIAAIYQKTPSHSIDEPTRHYVLHHNHVPPWILMKNVTFSNSINLFSLMKSPQLVEAETAENFGNYRPIPHVFPSHTGAPCLPSSPAMCGRTCGTPRLL